MDRSAWRLARWVTVAVSAVIACATAYCRVLAKHDGRAGQTCDVAEQHRRDHLRVGLADVSSSN